MRPDPDSTMTLTKGWDQNWPWFCRDAMMILWPRAFAPLQTAAHSSWRDWSFVSHQTSHGLLNWLQSPWTTHNPSQGGDCEHGLCDFRGLPSHSWCKCPWRCEVQCSCNSCIRLTLPLYTHMHTNKMSLFSLHTFYFRACVGILLPPVMFNNYCTAFRLEGFPKYILFKVPPPPRSQVEIKLPIMFPEMDSLSYWVHDGTSSSLSLAKSKQFYIKLHFVQTDLQNHSKWV